VDVPLPWERLLWSGRPSPVAAALWVGERYALTDFRLVRIRGAVVDEIAIQDIADVSRRQSRLERLAGSASIVVERRGRRTPPLVLHSIRQSSQLAALLALLAGDPNAQLDGDAVAAALAWRPREIRRRSESLVALGAVAVAIVAVAIGLHGRSAAVTFAPDDEIYPGGQKKDPEAIVQFMNERVMPWARATLGPLKGGADRVRCETCHGRDAEARGWRMPGVAALPQPDVRERGWEIYSGGMDAQMRNAIYGYVAESDKQTKAAYMREIVMPGMSRLLHRQPYDFTKPYEYNRQHAAFGCYHCHKVK
jgi:cytochrome c553